MTQKSKHKKETELFFDNHAKRFAKVDLLQFNPAREYEFNKIHEFLSLKKGSSIIEIGSGVGKYVLPLLKLGYKVTAVDISKQSLEVLKKQAKKNKLDKNLQIYINNFEKPIQQNKYDAGICISTYHVLSDNEKTKQQIIQNFVKSIKPGGAFLMVEPNPYNPLFYPFYLMYYPKEALRFSKLILGSSENTLKKLFSKVGIEKVSIRYVGFLPFRFINPFPYTIHINNLINKIPIINKTSSFIYMKGYRSKITQNKSNK
jgi:2-polyprenyl-3-methyl-5-hydroxy-6-metoxy-1,4-benzoquinol methylase